MACAATHRSALLGWQLLPATPLPPPTGSASRSSTSVRATAILLEVAEGAVLVDQGPPEADVARAAPRLGVRPLTALVLTHPQRDHVGGAADVLRRLAVDACSIRALRRSSAYERCSAGARPRSAASRSSRRGPETRSGSAGCACACSGRTVPATESEDPNLHAIVLLATYGEIDVLLTADAETDVTARLLSRPVEILKVAHHGSADAGPRDELRVLRPRSR